MVTETKTFTNLSEAKKYIAEKLKEWEEAGDIKKILSLAKTASKWHGAGSGPADILKILNTQINQLSLSLKRAQDLGGSTRLYEEELKYYNEKRNEILNSNEKLKAKEIKRIEEKENKKKK